MSELTPKQERFCQEYVKDLNGTQAAIRAGYSDHTANEQAARLLANVSVKAKISALQSDLATEMNIDAKWVLERFKAISERCMQGEPILDNRGIPTGEWKFDAAGANKAVEMIGKHIGFFATDNSQKQLILNPPIIQLANK